MSSQPPASPSWYLWFPMNGTEAPVSLLGEGEEVTAHCEEVARNAQEQGLPFEVRLRIRVLLYSVIASDALREVFDGILVPPPWSFPDLSHWAFSREDVLAAAKAIPEDYVPIVILMPFHLALKSGVYDSRLRTAMTRLCHLFSVSFELVLNRELALANVDIDELAVAEREAQKDSVKGSKKSKFTVKRIATIGAFSAIGGVLLVFTGGLAAPVIAPAFGALLGATTATAGAVGVGGSVLFSGTAIATLFAGLVGVASHTAALGALLTPMLTAGNLTAIFGASGAGLAGFKGHRRTGGVEDFRIRSTTEVAEVDQTKKAAMVTPQDFLSDSFADCLMQENSTTEKQSCSVTHDALDKRQQQLEKVSGLKGVVVPNYARSIGLVNLSTSDRFKERNRIMTFGIENQVEGVVLVLKAFKLISGEWGHCPAVSVASGSTAISLTHNKRNFPTGCGSISCYEMVLLPETYSTSHPLHAFAKRMAKKAAGGAPKVVHFWFLAQTAFTGGEYVGCWIDSNNLFSKGAEGLDTVQKNLEANCSKENLMVHLSNFLILETKFHPAPHCTLRLSAEAAALSTKLQEKIANVTYPFNEIHQHLLDVAPQVEKKRRHFTIVLKNETTETLNVLGLQVDTGELIQTGQFIKEFAFPSIIPSGEAAIASFGNASLSMLGAEVKLIVSYVQQQSDGKDAVSPEKGEDRDDADKRKPTNANSSRRTIFFKLESEVTTLNTVQCDASIHTTLQDARQHKLKPAEHPNESYVDKFELGTSAACRTEKSSAIISIKDTVDSRLRDPKMSVVVGVSGFITTLDASCIPEDQQVSLWKPILEKHRLFCDGEPFVVHWENDLQRNFSNTVGLELDDSMSGTAQDKAVEQAKKQAVNQAMQSAVFAGYRAFDAIAGALALPMYAVWSADVIDNSFATLNNRAEEAGQELAIALLSDLRGNRPVTLVGFSFGANVIIECLLALEKTKAIGIVENVFLLGATVPSSRSIWTRARSAVAGRMVNVYNRSDWFLWALYRINTGKSAPVSGLTRIAVVGVENIDASSLVETHASYAAKLEEILSLIPQQPTPQSIIVDAMGGAPGALVSPGETLETAERLISTMSSMLNRTPYAAISITNRLKDLSLRAADNHSQRRLEPITQLVCTGAVPLNCNFDYCPTSTIPSANSGVFGIVAAEDPVAGGQDDDGSTGESEDTPTKDNKKFGCVVGYHLPIRKTQSRKLEAENDHAVADCPADGDEDYSLVFLTIVVFMDDLRKQVFGNVLVDFVEDPSEELLKNCSSFLDKYRRSSQEDTLIFLEQLLECNDHQTTEENSNIHAVRREISLKNGKVLNLSAVFSLEANDYLPITIAGFFATMAPSCSDNSTVDVIIDENDDSKDTDDMLFSQGNPLTLTKPAKLFPIEELHSALESVADHYGGDGCSSSSHAALERTISFTMKDLQSALREHRQTATIQPVVFVNCGEEELVYSQKGSSGSLFDLLPGVRWLRIPPCTIPPGHCAVAVVLWNTDLFGYEKLSQNRQLSCGLTTVTYETTDAGQAITLCVKVSENSEEGEVRGGLECFVQNFEGSTEGLAVDSQADAAESLVVNSEQIIDSTRFLVAMMSPKSGSQGTDCGTTKGWTVF